MPPKKASSASKEAASSEPPHDYKTGDIVLCKVKGFPEWPGKLQVHDTAPPAVRKVQGNKQYLVRFFPDGDYHWAILKEMKYLSPKSIDAYLSDTSKKGGKLRKSYEIAQDPAEWEAEVEKKGASAMADDDEDENEDVDMLDEDDDGEGKPKAKKRKREPAAKKEKAPKKEPASKKRKTDEKKEKAPAKGAKAESKEDAKPADDDNSEEAKKVKGWRASLQKAFLTKGVPPANKMDEYDQMFKDMEAFEMQTQWLTSSKLGKVLKKMAALDNIAKNEELKITDRCTALVEKWKEMMSKEGEDPAAATAGDVTMLPADDAKPASKDGEKAATNGAANGTEE